MSDDIRTLLRAGAEEHTYGPPDIGAIRRRARRRRARGIVGVVVVAAVFAVPALRFVEGLSNPTVRFAPATGTTADRAAREVPAGNVCARVLTASSGIDPLQRLGLQDRVPRALLAFGRMVPSSCIVDPSGDRALAATVELVSDDGRPLATWVLLPLGQAPGVDGARVAIADPGSVLHRPDPSRQYLDAESAFVIVEDSPVADDIAAIAVDAAQDMVAVWEQLPAAASSAFEVAAAPEPEAQPREPATGAWRLGGGGLELPTREAGDSYVTEVVLNDGEVVKVELGRAAQGEGRVSYVPTSSVSLDHPQTPRTAVTGVDPTVVARQECAAVGRSSGCDARRDERLDNGAVLTVWDVGDGEPFVTVALADWTLVLEGPDAGLAREIAAGLVWSVDDRGFLRLRSSTPQVRVGVGFGLRTLGAADGGSVRIAKGCPAGTAELQMLAGAATWCTDGYLVEATGGSRAWQTAAHDSLAIRPAAGRPPR